MTGPKLFTKCEFDYYIWNHCEKYIQISTNLRSIGIVICKIGFKFEEFCDRKTLLCMVSINGRVVQVLKPPIEILEVQIISAVGTDENNHLSRRYTNNKRH